MNKSATIFSFNIPTQAKNEFQNICKYRCLGMTSVLNFYINKFISENRDLGSKYSEIQTDDDFVSGIFPDDQDRW